MHSQRNGAVKCRTKSREVKHQSGLVGMICGQWRGPDNHSGAIPFRMVLPEVKRKPKDARPQKLKTMRTRMLEMEKSALRSHFEEVKGSPLVAG